MQPKSTRTQDLIIEHDSWALPGNTNDILPPRTDLRSVRFDCTSRTSYPTFVVRSDDAQTIHRGLAKWLETNSNLSSLSFFSHPIDNLSILPLVNTAIESSASTGSILSLRHGDGELLYLTLPLQDIDVSDDIGGVIRKTVIYSEGDTALISHVVKTYPPVLQIYTKAYGCLITLEVLEDVLGTEGLSMEEWSLKGRGAIVGEEAWAVLMEWVNEERRWGETDKPQSHAELERLWADVPEEDYGEYYGEEEFGDGD